MLIASTRRMRAMQPDPSTLKAVERSDGPVLLHFSRICIQLRRCQVYVDDILVTGQGLNA